MFVSPPSKERYRGYPQVKVGDFGAALLMLPDDLRNAADIDIYGTPGYMAPVSHRLDPLHMQNE